MSASKKMVRERICEASRGFPSRNLEPVRPWWMVDPQHWSVAGYLDTVWCFDMIDCRYFEDYEDEKDDKNLPRWGCE